MPCWKRSKERLLRKLGHNQFIARYGQRKQRQVDRAFMQALQQRRRNLLYYVHRHARMLAREAAQHLGEKIGSDGWDRTQHHLTALNARHLPNLDPGLTDLTQDR